jgi:glycosyltransferase involved in cell wall biosynthesis
MHPAPRSTNKSTVLFGVTVPSSARAFLVGQLGHYVKQGWDVHLVCGEPGLEDFARAENIAGLHLVPAKRDPSSSDPKTLFGLIRLMRQIRPTITIMSTPKVGVFGTLAACVCRVPLRIYFTLGYRAEGLSGPKRSAFMALERLACRFATHVVSVSPSLREIMIQESICPPNKIRVLGYGAINGIDINRFSIPSQDEVTEARTLFDVTEASHVIAVVSRLTKDKGLGDLPKVWSSIHSQYPTSTLLIAGVPEPQDDEDAANINLLRNSEGVRMLGFISNVDELFKASDLVLLLSRREGIGLVPLEAAAIGVPTVAYRVTGVMDTIEDRKTGRLVTHGDRNGVILAVSDLLESAELRTQMGQAARKMVEERYSTQRVWNEWDTFLSEITTPS